MSSSCVLLNRIVGLPFMHGFGLHLGDPLSCLLFVISIGLLTKIHDVTTRDNLLHNLHGRGTILRNSFYAVDTEIFVAPIKEDIQNLSSVPRILER
jgi:hypothetical protein